jgi:hypothetical protein
LLENSVVKRNGDTKAVVDEYVQSSLTAVTYKKTESDNILESDVVDLKSFSVYDEKEGISPSTGGPCYISVLLDFKDAVRNPGIMISLRSLEGVNLLNFNTQPISGLDTGICFGKVLFTLLINELPLSGGSYLLMVGVKYIPFDPIISLTEVGQFEVSPKDYYSSGRLLDNRAGFIVAKHSWSIEKEEVLEDMN